MQDSEIASSTRKPAGPKTRAKDETDALEASIASAAKALCALQRADGHFVFELEADATIPAEYVLMCHYRGEPVDAECSKGAQHDQNDRGHNGRTQRNKADSFHPVGEVMQLARSRSSIGCHNWRGIFCGHRISFRHVVHGDDMTLLR